MRKLLRREDAEEVVQRAHRPSPLSTRQNKRHTKGERKQEIDEGKIERCEISTHTHTQRRGVQEATDARTPAYETIKQCVPIRENKIA